jgi:hypothetical protein
MAGAVLHPAAIVGLAYMGGKLGTLVGADLANLGKVRRLGAPVASAPRRTGSPGPRPGRREELGQRLERLSSGRASEPAAVQGVADRADGRKQRGGHQVGRNASDTG